MATISRSALLNHPAARMFELVNDIEAYPEYMKGCVNAKVLKREGDMLEAQLVLSKGGIKQTFITRNVMHEPDEILLELVDGPFESFGGVWSFQSLKDDACKVSLHLDFKMKNSLIGRAATKLFNPMANNLVDAVCKRAKELYGS